MDDDETGEPEGAENSSVTDTGSSAGRLINHARPAEKHMTKSPVMTKGQADIPLKNCDFFTISRGQRRGIEGVKKHLSSALYSIENTCLYKHFLVKIFMPGNPSNAWKTITDLLIFSFIFSVLYFNF